MWEVAGILGLTLKHATKKHAQTIGLLERPNASIRQALKIEKASENHCGIKTSVLIYNTSYHLNIDCDPSRPFHGHFPYNILDLKLRIGPQQPPIPTSQIA